MGGSVNAITFIKSEIEESAFGYHERYRTQQDIVVGVNKYEEEDVEVEDILRVDPESEREQLERLKAFKENRDQELADKRLEELREAARGDENLLAADPRRAEGLAARSARSAARCATSSGSTSPSREGGVAARDRDRPRPRGRGLVRAQPARRELVDDSTGGGTWVDFGAEGVRQQIGVGVHVLMPGDAPGRYHAESDQEGFLVLAGECVLIVEGEERRLRQWDYFHCPPGTAHITVGASEEPCAIFMLGARTPGKLLEYIAGPGGGDAHGVAVKERTRPARATPTRTIGPHADERLQALPWPGTARRPRPRRS